MIRSVVGLPMVCVLAGCTLQDPAPAPAANAEPPQGAAAAEYRLNLDPTQPLRLRGELDLRGHVGTARTAQVRGAMIGVASQVRAPHCDGVPLAAESESGPWAVPDGCERLSWDVVVTPLPEGGLDASLQQTVYFPEGNWWVVSEPSSLLRVNEAESTASALQVDAGPAGIAVWGRRAKGSEALLHVPSIAEPPEFHVLGSPPAEQHRLGPLQVEYVLDHPSRIAALPLAEAHQAVLAYFLEVLQAPAALPEADSRLLVVWLGMDAGRGHAGGAAGGRSFLANYIDGSPEDAAMNSARTLMILAHEQFHQLHGLLGGGPQLPTWLVESLAQYYALSALQRTALPEPVVRRALDHFIAPDRPVEHGLLALQARHEEGDPEAYDRFYDQGATFWHEVDRALKGQADGGEGLDSLVLQLVREGGDGPGLPDAFRQRLLERGGEPLQQVLDRYL